MNKSGGFVEKLKNGQTAYGIANTYPVSTIIKDIGLGWDFVWIDTQHAQHTYESVLHALEAARAIGVDAVVRVYENSYGVIGKFMDLQPTAVMFPMINNEYEAKQIVKHSYNKPFGIRSFGGGTLNGHPDCAETKPFIIAQIETIEAVKNCESIAAVQGIDMLFVGATDLRLDFGIPLSESELDHDQTYSAMMKVAGAVKKHGKHCGCVMTDIRRVRQVADMGYQMISCGTDSRLLSNKSKEILTQVAKSPLL